MCIEKEFCYYTVLSTGQKNVLQGVGSKQTDEGSYIRLNEVLKDIKNLCSSSDLWTDLTSICNPFLCGFQCSKA